MIRRLTTALRHRLELSTSHRAIRAAAAQRVSAMFDLMLDGEPEELRDMASQLLTVANQRQRGVDAREDT